MKMKSTVMSFLLILVLIEIICCQGCWKHEREALLALNVQFDHPLPWVNNTDCCKWNNVRCNTTTWRVEKLDLHGVMDYDRPGNWYINYSDFLVFEDLKSLSLSMNSIAGCIERDEGLRLSNLEVIDLSYNFLNNTESIISCLDELSSLKSLDLSYNGFDGTSLHDFCDLSNLEHLVLNGNSELGNEFLKSIGSLTSLKVLSLTDCLINGTLPAIDWSKLKKLEKLDLSHNEFEGPLPSSFCNMTFLWMLDLSWNNFTGNFGSNIGSLTSLEYLAFDGNQFEVPVSFTPFANHSNIKFIHGEGNKVILDSHPTLQTWVPKFQLQEFVLPSQTETNSLPLPNFLLYQYNLSYLDLTGWKLEGDFPNWLLENNTKLTSLVLSKCSFTGTFQLPSQPLHNLRSIDVSNNAITGQLPSNNISSIFPSLQYLDMSVNNIHGSIPHEFGQMNLLYELYLSNNHLIGEIPKNISGAELLAILELSNNKLDGSLFPTLSMLGNLMSLSLDGNSFSGRIPSGLFNISSTLLALDLSNNHFLGKLPSGYNQSWSNLGELCLSNNHFEGSIPSEFVELESLVYLDLSLNMLTGSVPSSLTSSLWIIHLNNNKLSGLPKRMFNGSSSLTILDLSYNHITSGIQDMIQVLFDTRLKILLLKDNHFTGQIPKQLCQLMDITILDLSCNNLSGTIPNCLGKMPFDKPIEMWILHGLNHSIMSRFIEKVKFSTKKNFYTYMGTNLAYMTGIDLSSNKLNGSIPSELGNLTKILAMNLSYNDLQGKIPATFSNLVQVESLDLSFNKLSGSIPSQLNELTSLEVFSVAHNNLSGAIPYRKGQFLTFDESCYEGNPFLCGPPLPNSCNASILPNATILPNGLYIDGDNDSLVDIYVFWVSFVVSYASILLVIAAVLYINPYWRRAWFYYLELVSTNCYYFIEDKLRKFSINI